MKSIVFKSVSIKNFLSVGDSPLEITFKEGITLITGENKDNGSRNGVGKSSLIESIYWALFGNTMRDIKKDRIIHKHSKKTCQVTLEFAVCNNSVTDSYKIVRSLEPSKLNIFKNEEDVTLSTIPKTEELIKELIGANEEVFQNAVIMTANNTMPFMAQKKIDKRKFVEGILGLGIFGDMLLKVRADYNEKKKENDVVASKFSDKNKNITIYQNQLETNKKTRENKIASLREKIKQNEEKIEKISDSASINKKITETEEELKTKEDFLEKLDNGLTKATELVDENTKLLQEKNYSIKQIKDEISSHEKVNGSCPTCNRKYNSENTEEHLKIIESLKQSLAPIQGEAKELSTKIEEINKKKTSIKTSIISTKQTIKDLESSIQTLKLASQQAGQLETRNKEILEEISEIENQKDGVQDLIDNAKKELVEIEKEIGGITKQLSILDSSKFIVSEEGVKTFIVKKMLSVLNSQLNFYLRLLDAPCKCEFDELFEETIYNNNGVECSYFNFSGGERKRIDLAILFMFQDILRMQTGINFNLSMYDELLDSALDEKGVTKILELLKERCENNKEAIYIVSHNKSAMNSNFTDIILLTKEDGVTSIAS